MNIPNTLSVFRIILAPLIPVLVLKEKYSLTFFLIVFLALTDFLDGYLARKLKKETSVGKILDPLGDKFFTTFSLFSYTFLSKVKISSYVFILLLIRDIFLVLGGILLLRRKVIPSPSIYGKLTTLFVSLCLTITAFINVIYSPLLHKLLPLLETITLFFVVLSFFHYTLKGIRELKEG